MLKYLQRTNHFYRNFLLRLKHTNIYKPYKRIKPEPHILTGNTIFGKELVDNSYFNKGTAFSVQERLVLGLTGHLPERVFTLEEQTERAYRAYKVFMNDIDTILSSFTYFASL